VVIKKELSIGDIAACVTAVLAIVGVAIPLWLARIERAETQQGLKKLILIAIEPVYSRYQQLQRDKTKDNWPTGSLEREFARKMGTYSYQATIFNDSQMVSVAQVATLAESNADKNRIGVADIIVMVLSINSMMKKLEISIDTN